MALWALTPQSLWDVLAALLWHRFHHSHMDHPAADWRISMVQGRMRSDEWLAT